MNLSSRNTSISVRNPVSAPGSDTELRVGERQCFSQDLLSRKNFILKTDRRGGHGRERADSVHTSSTRSEARRNELTWMSKSGQSRTPVAV